MLKVIMKKIKILFFFKILHDPRFIPGWSELFHGGPKVSISTATLFIGVLFFIVPRNAEFYRACATGGT